MSWHVSGAGAAASFQIKLSLQQQKTASKQHFVVSFAPMAAGLMPIDLLKGLLVECSSEDEESERHCRMRKLAGLQGIDAHASGWLRVQ